MRTDISHGAELSSLRPCQALAPYLLAVACLLPGACHEDDAGRIGLDEAQPAGQAVETSVNSVIETDRLATSTLESRQATPGTHFVLLEVTARNTDPQPQVFSEGRLISISESRERSFATPVSMLADEFLTLQVLQPSARVHGKIAYEVPDHLPGVLYWQPGTGAQRILLHVGAAQPATTSGNAVDDAADTASVPVQAPAAPAPLETTSRPPPSVAAKATPPTPPAPLAPPVEPSAGTVTGGAPAGGNARIASAAPLPAPATAPAHNEPARNLACQALVSRNDAAEKGRYLGFFSRECANYAMPSAWLAGAVAATPPASVADNEPAAHVPSGAPRWPPRPGPAFDCDQADTRAEQLICEDAVLSLMDWELNRALAQASRVVDDPEGLQRDEDSWRHRMLDACGTSRCIETVYDQRTAQLQALADRQR